MKYKDLKKIKPGDKVVVEVADIDKENHYWTAKLDGIGIDGWIENEAVIAVYHEPAKIKMTEAEKKEFDKLLKNINNSNSDFADILNAIWNSGGDYHNLRRRLFANANLIVDRKNQLEFARKNQLEFARALENPDLIEVEKPKKYYVHLFDGVCGYLIYFGNGKRYVIDTIEIGGQSVFTKDEIKEINNRHSTFEIKSEALEEAKEDE